jgi:hypothetical protein
MIYRLVVMGIASIVLLAWIWMRNRRLSRDRSAQMDTPGRGVVGEATTAYEDLARQFLGESRDKPVKGARSAKFDRPR